MIQTNDSDPADALREHLESANALLSDREEGELSEEDASNLREHVERISEASFEEMFAAAGFDGDDLGPGDVPRLLSEGSSEEVHTLRQLLDVSALDEDAPADDEVLADHLDEVLGDDGETAGVDEGDEEADDEDANLGEADGSEVDATEAGADQDSDEPTSGGDGAETEGEDTAAESGGSDDVTFADVFSGAASLAKDWSSSGGSTTDDADDADDADDVSEEVDEASEDEGEADDDEDESEANQEDEDEDDSLFDTEDIKERLTGDDEDESSDSDGKRRSRRRRFSTVPSRRSDMGKSPRFSTVKARK